MNQRKIENCIPVRSKIEHNIKMTGFYIQIHVNDRFESESEKFQCKTHSHCFQVDFHPL